MAEQNKTPKESVVKILLTNSSHAKKFEGENLIHQEEFDETIRLINESLANAKNDPDSKYLHNTITILGTRGSGKTSFLLSINKFLEKSNEIEVLNIIDPTLIEEKGHVFLNVISLIMDLVETKLNQDECHKSAENKSSTYTRKEWRSFLNDLAAGLPSIDGIGSHNADSWQDPEFVMDNGLKGVSASQKLANNFNRFLKASLDILGKKAFLLMFDDIDVDASKGWIVLETIRKYFTSARLITLLSGDLKLYSTVVRQKKWENFGKEILAYEGKQQNQISRFNDMVTELEAQYLQKIMQTNLRIHIPTLEQKNKKIQNIKVCTTSSESSKNEIICTGLKVYYYEILKYFGVHNEFQADCYFFFLLRQPLRSQIQFMNLFKVADKYTLSEPNRLLDIFYSDLSEKGINIQLISLSDTDIVSEILRFLNKEKRLFDIYQLQPTTTDNSLNASLAALNFLLSHRIQEDNIYLVFEYFIKIGYVRNLLPLIADNSEKNVGPNINDLCVSSNLFNDSVFRDQVGHMIAYIRASIDFTTKTSEFKLNAGTVPLYGERAKRKQKLETLSNRIDSHLSKEDNLLKRLVYIPLSANQYSKKHSSLLTYSIYLLLATIAEMLKRNSASESMVISDLLELSQLRSFVMPDFRGANDDDENEATDDAAINEEETSVVSDLEKTFVNRIEEWRSEGRNIQINPHVMGKISTRLSYALDNIETAYNGKENLGQVFHAQIVSFLNAVLIEDVREKSGIEGLNLNNTRFSDKIFISNIKSQLVEEDGKLKVKKQEELTFSRWLFKCPLLICYLNIEEKKQRNMPKTLKDINTIQQAIESYCTFTQEKDASLFKDFSVFSILEKVSIRNRGKENLSSNRISSTGKNVPNKQLSLGATRQYDDIIKLLKAIPLSFDLFKENGRSETTKNNKVIIAELEKQKMTGLSSFNIATFRKHLKDNKIKW
ncbi:hypothetical protein [Pinibacter soli]|uniref:KAP NTPase domain-containing protein n=1 Tax=Pinibacter soli TaxID=3044211 RepID=A0ABT6RFR9_9BACT|nr:hypothetical protein [Pinibacter soli]MDI3321412.1 hypothetical protein [Pinibacter soli]